MARRYTVTDRHSGWWRKRIYRRCHRESFPLRVIVQDIEMNEAMKVDNKEANLEWVAHDFFTPQTVVADVYLYRFIFHNYPDEKAATTALKRGTRILINDSGLPDPGEVRWFDERAARLVY